ncbi:MAG: TIGR02281 family clan AA aspartic protease [Arenicellales bacterium]|jgi:aspartyl protease family protein
MLLCCGLAWAATAFGVDKLTLLALFKDKALLQVDGERRMLVKGETGPEGVTLVSADSNRAVVIVDGRKEVLQLGMGTRFPGASDDVSPSWSGPETLTLWAQDDGFFYASGQINGAPVRFLVDTGSNTVAMNQSDAERLGIDYRKGQRGMASTASGVAPMYLVKLDRVSVGDITLHDIDAGVLMSDHPDIPLLGMSFLGKLDMVRNGKRLDLKRR